MFTTSSNGARRRRIVTATIAAAVAAAVSTVGVVAPAGTASAASNFTVDSVDDGPDAVIDGNCATATGTCSLRAAIMEAKAAPDAVSIAFAIPGSGFKTIQLTSTLPGIDQGTGGITIDGFTQPGAAVNSSPLVDNAKRVVGIRGGGVDAFDGLVIQGANNVVRGLVINNFATAVSLLGRGATGNRIIGNLIGLSASGEALNDGRLTDSTRFKHCIEIRSGASSNRIGTPAVADRNVISGCPDKAVALFSSFTFGNRIQNNIMGLDPTGTKARPSFAGVDINSNANGNIVGGTGAGERNVISGNRYEGVEVSHEPGTINNMVVGNFIGTTPDGGSASGATRNGGFGVRIEGRPNCNNEPCAQDIRKVTIADNVIVNSGQGGVLIDKGAFDSVVTRNRIGVTTTGQVVGNGSFGVMLAAGSQRITVGPDNVIAGSLTGVEMTPFSLQPQGGVESNTSFNTITQNSISDQGGLGIDLLPVGEPNTAGSSLASVNEGILAPVLTSTGGVVRASTCASCVVEIFAANRAAGKYGSGVTYIGTSTANAAGNATFTAPTGGWPTVVTATTTSTSGSTSEFAANIDPSTTVVAPPPAPKPRSLISLVPARLLETRSGAEDKTIDGQFQGIGRQAAGQTIELQVAGRGGVPSDASAAFMNLTAILSDDVGYLTVWPCGSPRPLSSNVNYFPGQIAPNSVFTKIGTGGKVCIYNLAATDIIADVSGYAPAGSDLGLLVPARILETRSGAEDKTIDGQFQGIGRQAAGQTIELQVAGRAGVPENAAGAFLNLTAILSDDVGYLTVYPCGSPRPLASNVNYFPGQIKPNSVFTKIGVDGKVCIYNLAAADIIADVSGFAPTGSTLGTLVPARLLETRSGAEDKTIDGQFQGIGRQAADQTIELQVAGRGGVPADAEAAFLNLTAILSDDVGYLTVYPCGTERPLTSNVNYFPGQIAPNSVFTKLGVDGKVCIYNLAAADIIADVSGYSMRTS